MKNSLFITVGKGKNVLLICALLAFALVLNSCSKEEIVSPKITTLKFNVNVKNGSTTGGTKAVKTGWENGDKIFVFFNVSTGAATGHLDAMKYVTLTYNGGQWEGVPSESLSGDVGVIGTSGTMYGVYFPFGEVAIASDGDNGVIFRTLGNTNASLNGQPIFTYYMNGSSIYTVETLGSVATLDADITINIPEDYVYFFINKDGEKFKSNEKYTLSVEGIIPTACSGFSAGTFSESTLMSSRAVPGYVYGDAGIAFSGKIDATWGSEADHKFLLYTRHEPNTFDEPTLGKTFHNTLSSHASIRLNMSSGWTKYGFRGYEVSDGVLMLDGDTFTLTDDSPFDMWYYYNNNTSLNKYYFTWTYLRTEFGAAGSGIVTNSDKLPSGWTLPTSGSQNPPTTDWGKILMGAPKSAIKIEKSDGTVVSVTAANKGCAFVKIDNTYYGMLLLRDGSFIPKEGNLQYWGNESSLNIITSEQFAVLKEAGCLLIPSLGKYTGSEWRDRTEGNYQTASYFADGKGMVMNFYYYNNKYTFSTSTSFSTTRYAPVRLVKAL